MKCPHCGKMNAPIKLGKKKQPIIWHQCSKFGSKYGQRVLEGVA